MSYTETRQEIEGTLAATTARLQQVREAIGQVIVGQDEVVEQVLLALLAGGHVLLEGVPGLGKTALVRTVARVTGLAFRRIQFTPDLMPADITGTQVFEEQTGFHFEPGPVFSQIVLADEINRATPKTQSALLEAMQEQTVTVGGITHPLPRPFFVLATQNPLEMEGTYPLPEAQLDRFLFKIEVPFPSEEELVAIAALTTGAEEAVAPALLAPEELLRWQLQVRHVVVVDDVLRYAVRLVLATHPEREEAPAQVRSFVRYGASPRGVQALVLGARARALLAGRSQAGYDDIRQVALPALRHRLFLSYEAAAEGLASEAILQQLLAAVGGQHL